MGEWWSIEVFDGEFPASQWRETYSPMLIETAVTHGATEWGWVEHRWGVVFEVEFAEDDQWEAFSAMPSVRAALDAVPDPVNGLLVCRGRGGGAGSLSPRHPRPGAGAGALALPEPGDAPVIRLVTAEADGLAVAGSGSR
jgi:hypothetical protein